MSGCFPRAEGPADELKDPYYLAGKRLVTERDYKGAIEAFEKSLEVNPRSASAHFELGLLCEQRESDFPAAIYHYSRVVKLRGKNYPGELAEGRVKLCEQEMVKAVALPVVDQKIFQQNEQLKNHNQQLLAELETLRAQVAARVLPATNPVATAGQTTQNIRQATASRPIAETRNAAESGANRASSLERSASVAANAAPRTHLVQPRETPAAIARQYKVSLNALLAANPGLEPRRMRAGQSINIPAS